MTDYVLGVSAFYHDSAAALVADGKILAAAQEERFTRVRHDKSFPRQAVRYCLEAAGITLSDLESVVFYEDSEVKFQRVLESFSHSKLVGFSRFREVFSEWNEWKRDLGPTFQKEFDQLDLGTPKKIVSTLHHRAHAASAFFPSPFASASVLCVDGVGEFDTTSIWKGSSNELEYVNSICYPHSLGLLYSAFTYFCGFKVDSGEYKLMGLAPYGEPAYATQIRDKLINLRPDGSFSLNLEYFEFINGYRMVGERFEHLFGTKIRSPEDSLTKLQCDLAASVQKVTEEGMLGLTKAALLQCGERNLCLAGGVALNCVANGFLHRSGLADSIWIQPAAGDAGGALGAALDTSVQKHGRPHLSKQFGAGANDAMSGALLGPSFDNREIEQFLKQNAYKHVRFDNSKLYQTTAGHLADGKIVGWFQNRMEFGPRALGARSILGDPRNPRMQKELNLKTKFRESFRPFAPAVLEADASQYFDLDVPSPYMLLVARVTDKLCKPTVKTPTLDDINEVRSALPAVTHVDYSARIQTVSESGNPEFYKLLSAFKKLTGCSVLVNTSFNVRGEPIVMTPEHAYLCFMRTNIDVLVLGSFILLKSEQPTLLEDENWRKNIPLD